MKPDFEAFAKKIIQLTHGYVELDAGDVQEAAISTGVLIEAEIAEPCCDDGCVCSELGVEFPTMCYRNNY